MIPYIGTGNISSMSDKKIRIKVSELRTLVREAMSEASTIAGRQNMMTQGDDRRPPSNNADLDDGKGLELLADDEIKEVTPPGFEKAVKAMKKDKSVDNPFAVAWSMKKKGFKPSDTKTKKVESRDPNIVEFRSFDDDFADKLTDKKYEEMAKQLFLAWSERGVDVDWAGVVKLYARNHSKNLATEIDSSKLYEKVLNLVEKHENENPLQRAKGKS